MIEVRQWTHGKYRSHKFSVKLHESGFQSSTSSPSTLSKINPWPKSRKTKLTMFLRDVTSDKVHKITNVIFELHEQRMPKKRIYKNDDNLKTVAQYLFTNMIINTTTTIQVTRFHENDKMQSVATESHISSDANNSEAIIKTMCRLCFLCFWETYKIIEGVIQVIQEPPNKPLTSERPNELPPRRPIPYRTRSKVIQVDRAWLKRSVLNKRKESTDICDQRRPSKRSHSSPHVQLGRKMSRSLCRKRYHSYPPIGFRRSLERIDEVDELAF